MPDAKIQLKALSWRFRGELGRARRAPVEIVLCRPVFVPAKSFRDRGKVPGDSVNLKKKDKLDIEWETKKKREFVSKQLPALALSAY